MPINSELIQRADLLNKINELTTRISEGASNLNLSATQAKNFASGLETIRLKAQEATSDLSRLNQQLLKVAASIESGNPSRIRLGGGTRVSTGQYIDPYQQGLTQEGISVLTAKEAEAERLRARLTNATKQQPFVYSSGGETQADYDRIFNQFYGTQRTNRPSANIGTGLGTRRSAWFDWMGQSVGGPGGYDTSQGDWWDRFQRWRQSYESAQARGNRSYSGYTSGGGSPFTSPPYNNPPGGSGGRGGSNQPPYGWPPVGPFEDFPYDPFQAYRRQGRSYPFSSKPAWWDSASKKAGYYGFKPEDLESITTEASSGISRLSYRTIDEVTGAFKNLNLTVDKSGNILVDTQKRFRDFFTEVGRNTLEFLKWSLAVTLVLGPLQKLGQLMQTAIENESRLADISITLAGSQKSVSDVFAASTEIAQKSGEEINTVLEAYQVAYRAVGASSDSIERFTQANKLLSDSLVLSKLTGMDEAKAIDTLSAALRQAFSGEGSLSRGNELLDKWIRTTKVANVDLETLATGFAIVGDAADAAGMGVDQLNGLLAAIAETGVASGKEVANAARAMISGFQSDQAKKALGALGISTELEGQTRPFQEILDQVAKLRQSGVLGGEQFNQLTLALGGGSRRQAVWSTLIDNYARVGQVAEESSRAGGDAQEALAKKTETVQTSITRLSNAFQTLAQTMGTKNGLLDDFKLLVNLGQTLVQVFDTLAGSTGKAFPILMTGAIGALALSGKTPQSRMMLSPAGMLSNALVPEQQTLQATQAARLAFAQQAMKTPIYKGMVGLGVAAIPAISNLVDESLTGTQKAVKIGADIVGGIAGAFIGGGMGAVVGVTIAESFTSAIIEDANKDYSGAFGQLVSKITGKTVVPTGTNLTPAQQALKEAEKAVATYNPGGELGRIANKVTGREESYQTTFADLLRNATKPVFERRELERQLQEGKNYVPKSFEDLGNKEVLDLAIEVTNGQLKQLFIDYKKKLEAVENESLKTTGTLSQAAIDKFYQQNSSVIDKIATNQADSLFKAFSEGAINKSTLSSGLTATKNLQTLGTQWYKSFGQGKDVGQFFEQTGRITSLGNEQDIQAITDYATEINKVQAVIEDNTKSDAEHNKAIEKKAELLRIVTTLYDQLNQQILAQKELTPETNLIGYTQQQFQYVLSEAQKEQQARYQVEVAKGQMTPEEATARQKEATPFLAQLGAGNYEFLKKGTVEQKFFEEKLDELVKSGKLPKPGKEEQIGFQSYDMTSGKFKIYMQQYQSTLSNLVSKGYTPDESTQISIFKDGIIEPMKMDWKVVQLLLQQIADNTKEMTGEFNLPEGMSFNIPSRIAELWKKSLESSAAASGLYAGGVSSPGKPAGSGPIITTPSQLPNEISTMIAEEERKAKESSSFISSYDKLPASVKSMIESENRGGMAVTPTPQWSGGGTYMPMNYGPNGGNLQGVIDKLAVLNTSFQTFAERPISMNLTTTSVLYLDNRIIGEAISKYMGVRLSALGGSFAGGSGRTMTAM